MSEAEPKRFGLPVRHVTPIALILAPAIGAGVAALAVVTFSAFLVAKPSLEHVGSTFFGTMFFGALIGVVPSLLFGLPLHSLLMQNRVTGIFPYIGMGVGLALITLVVIASFPMMAATLTSSPQIYVPLIILFTLAGASAGLFFWLIRRPDRDPRDESR